MSRRRARELEFRALFGSARGDAPLLDAWADIRADLTEQTPGEAEEVYGEPLGADGLAFAERLVRAFAENQSELDGRLSGVLEGWTFAQMSQTDLAVLRLALTEMTYENLPPEVTFEVAVRIAKRYGGEESGRFVNGVLARLYRDRQGNSVQSSDVQDGGVQNSADQNATSQNGNARKSDAQDGDVRADIWEGATRNLEAPTETYDLTAESSTAVNTDFQGDVPIPTVPDAAQPDSENPDVADADVNNANINTPDLADIDSEDADSRLESDNDPRGRDVVER